MFQEKWKQARSFMAVKNIAHRSMAPITSVACLVPEGIFEGVTRLDLPVSSAGGRSWGRTLIWLMTLGCWERTRVC